jgi:hypothetical protein
MEDVEKNPQEEEAKIPTEVELDNPQPEEEQFDWKAEALKQQAIASRLKKKLSNPPLPTNEAPDENIVKSVKRLEEIENKRQFGFEHQLSPQETDFVFKISGNKPTKEILEDPFVKSGLEGYRSKKRLEANTPSSSSSSSIFKGKQFNEMTIDEKRKAYADASPINKK